MKIKITLSILTFWLATSLTAQKIAYLRQDTILSELPMYSKNIAKNDSLKKYFSEEINSESERINQKINDILKPYNPKEGENLEVLMQRFTQTDVKKFQLLQKESEMIEEKTKSYNELIQLDYKENVQPILTELNEVIKSYASKNKLDAIFILEKIGNSLAYINPKKDITIPIIEKIK